MRDRIGIYTGSFNPIHNAHLRIAEIAREAFDLDIVFLEACNDHYAKEGLATVKDRMHMIKLAIAHVPALSLGCYEASVNDRQPYTIETLKHYTQQYQDAQIFYICGGDVLQELAEFHDVDELLTKYKVLCISRDGFDAQDIIDKNDKLIDQRIEVVTGITGSDFSGTAIREIVKKDYTIRWLVPEGVRNYILEHGIYR